MSNTAYIFSSPQPILDAFAIVFGPPQHDAHIIKHRAIIGAYGSVAGWHARMAERAAIRRRLIDFGDADFVRRMERLHAKFAAMKENLMRSPEPPLRSPAHRQIRIGELEDSLAQIEFATFAMAGIETQAAMAIATSSIS